MKQNIYKGGLQPQEKKEKMLIVLIGGFLIYILKYECHMDDGTVKAIIEVYNIWAGYYLCKLKCLIQLKNPKNFGSYNILHYICTHIIKM